MSTNTELTKIDKVLRKISGKELKDFARINDIGDYTATMSNTKKRERYTMFLHGTASRTDV